MEIRIIYSPQDANKAKGLVVIIDVIRAFTTACFVMNNGARSIIPVDDLNLACKLKKDNPGYILIGERDGLKQPGFDFGNSPAEIENVNFRGKIIIQTTSRGTQAISNASKAKEVITGAFVNAQAVIDYIKKLSPKIVSLVCTDASGKGNEDIMFAKYVKGCLTGKPLDFEKIRKHLKNHPHAYKFLVKPMTKFAKRDFHLCLDLDRFNFVLRVHKDRDNSMRELHKFRNILESEE